MQSYHFSPSQARAPLPLGAGISTSRRLGWNFEVLTCYIDISAAPKMFPRFLSQGQLRKSPLVGFDREMLVLFTEWRILQDFMCPGTAGERSSLHLESQCHCRKVTVSLKSILYHMFVEHSQHGQVVMLNRQRCMLLLPNRSVCRSSGG